MLNPESREPEEKQEKQEELPQDQLRDFIIDVSNADDAANVWERMGQSGNDDFEALKSASEKVEAISKKYEDFLGKTGMELDLRENLRTPPPEANREKNPGKHITINIADGERFIDFLKSFNELELNEHRRSGLVNLAAEIAIQVQLFYKTNEPDDAFLKLVPVMRAMAEEYKRFSQATGYSGLQEYAEMFSDYNKAISGKFLREYLRLQHLEYDWEYNITDEFYNRTPSPETHSVEKYREVLDNLLDTLMDCAENKNALRIVRQKIEWLKDCLSDAEKVLAGKKEKKKRDYMVVNAGLRKKLEQLEKKLNK